MKAETSITVFGLYMVGIGVGLMVVPQGLTTLFGLGTADVGWTRLVGLLATLLGWYYIQASRAAFTPFLRWTIPARLFAALFMGALVGLGEMRPMLLLFAAIDTAGALWTWRCLNAATSR